MNPPEVWVADDEGGEPRKVHGRHRRSNVVAKWQLTAHSYYWRDIQAANPSLHLFVGSSEPNAIGLGGVLLR